MLQNEVSIRVFFPPLPGLREQAVFTFDGAYVPSVPCFEREAIRVARSAFAKLERLAFAEAGERVLQLATRTGGRPPRRDIGDAKLALARWKQGKAATEFAVSERSGQRRMWLGAAVDVPAPGVADDAACAAAITPLLDLLARI